MPRKPFIPTPDQLATVQAMAGYGIPHEDICKVVKNPQTGKPIDDKTLRRAFREQLDTGVVMASAKVAESLYKQATTGNVTAAIWWTKCRMGWKETQVLEHQGSNGGPLQVQNVTPEELAEAVKSVRDKF